MERFYIKENYDYIHYQKELDKIINSSLTIRAKIINIARFMACTFPKLPYFWGGGHGLEKNKMIGLDKEWGKLEEEKYDGSIEWIKGKLYPKSLDCSGFVSWCFVNANFDIDSFIAGNDGYALNSWELKQIGMVLSIVDDNIMSVVKCGDVAYMEGHVGIIISIDYFNNSIVVVHVSGSGYGTNITTISTITGLVLYDDIGEMPDDVEVNRIGKKYFTDIIHVDYRKK